MKLPKLTQAGFSHLVVPAFFILAIGGIGVYVLAASHAATLGDTITSGLSISKCLDDYQGSSKNGTKVDIWSCNKSAAQQWTLTSTHQIKSASGACLDNWHATIKNNAPIKLYACSTSTTKPDPAEVWTAYNGGFKNPASGKCLDDPASKTANGTELVLYTCNGGKNQHWTVTAPASSTGGGTAKPTPPPTVGGSTTSSPAPTSNASCTSPSFTTSSNAAWNNGGYTVQQDMWNNTSGGTQSLYACGYNNWYVVAKQPNSSSVKTYPDVLKNFNNPINTFKTLSTSYAEVAPHVGTYEYAYDIWINGMASSGATELMIWNDNYHQYPAGSDIGQTTIGSTTYNVYKGPMNNWTYIAFVPTNATITSGTDNLLQYFSYMSAKGWISTSATLDQIDYGIEICSTDGEPATFKVTNFSITSAIN